MAARRKTPEVLERMIEHVRYEIEQSLLFARFGNAWAEQLRPSELGLLTRNSVLEGGLIHLRCLIEFLGDKQQNDRVVARDYLPDDWNWRTRDQLTKVSDLSARLVHLGTDRVDDDFDWAEWLGEEGPVVLGAVRDFLCKLRAASPERYRLFVQPRQDLQPVEWVEVLGELLGDRDVDSEQPPQPFPF